MENPFGRRWIIPTVALEYITHQLKLGIDDANLEFQRGLLEEGIRARGEFKGPVSNTLKPLTPIDNEFWRFADPNFGGTVANIRTFQILLWFEVSAEDVLRVWGPKEAVATPQDSQPANPKPRAPRGKSKLDDVVEALRELYPQGRPSSIDRAHMCKMVEAELGRAISPSTLDRAREKAWPA